MLFGLAFKPRLAYRQARHRSGLAIRYQRGIAGVTACARGIERDKPQLVMSNEP